MAPSGTCWEPSPPGHKEPKTLPPATVYYNLPRPISLAPALLYPRPQHGPSAIRPRLTPLVRWLHLRHGLLGHTLLFNPSPLWLQLAPPSLRFHHCSQLPQNNFWPPDSHFEVVTTRIFTIFPPPQLFSCVWALSMSSFPQIIPLIRPYGPIFYQHSSMALYSSYATMGHIPGCGLNNHQESPV